MNCSLLFWIHLFKLSFPIHIYFWDSNESLSFFCYSIENWFQVFFFWKYSCCTFFWGRYSLEWSFGVDFQRIIMKSWWERSKRHHGDRDKHPETSVRYTSLLKLLLLGINIKISNIRTDYPPTPLIIPQLSNSKDSSYILQLNSMNSSVIFNWIEISEYQSKLRWERSNK